MTSAVVGEIYRSIVLPIPPRITTNYFGASAKVDVAPNSVYSGVSSLMPPSSERPAWPITTVVSTPNCLQLSNLRVSLATSAVTYLPVQIVLGVFRKNESDQLELYRTLKEFDFILYSSASGVVQDFYIESMPSCAVGASQCVGLLFNASNNGNDSQSFVLNVSLEASN